MGFKTEKKTGLILSKCYFYWCDMNIELRDFNLFFFSSFLLSSLPDFVVKKKNDPHGLFGHWFLFILMKCL